VAEAGAQGAQAGGPSALGPLRIVRALPHPAPPGRAHVVLPGYETLLIPGADYGEALGQVRPDGGFVVCEWDLAFDQQDVDEMARAVRRTHGDRILCAPYHIWAASAQDALHQTDPGFVRMWAMGDVQVKADSTPQAVLERWERAGWLAGLGKDGQAAARRVILAAPTTQHTITPVGRGQKECDVFSFGFTYLPERILRQATAQNVWPRLRYPTADRDFAEWTWNQGERACIVWGCRPKHIHFLPAHARVYSPPYADMPDVSAPGNPAAGQAAPLLRGDVSEARLASDSSRLREPGPVSPVRPAAAVSADQSSRARPTAAAGMLGLPMGRPPLVTVVTAAIAERLHTTLPACVRSVNAQTYRPLEHYVVFDGPSGLDIPKQRPGLLGTEAGVARWYMECGRRWHAATRGSWGLEARALALYLCHGEWACIVGDDDCLAPDHVARLVQAVQAADADYALCQYRYGDGRVAGDGRILEAGVGDGMILFRTDEYSRNPHLPGSYTQDYEWLTRFCAGKRGAFVASPSYLVRPHEKGNAA